jgi:type IV pilus assembly protein PilN
MPKINLLPIKAARRSETARNELFGMVVLFAGLAFVLYSWNNTVSDGVLETKSRISKMDQEIQNLSEEATRVEEFEAKAKILEDKQGIIEKLKRQKQGPAKALHDLATLLTELDKVWLTSITENEQAIQFEGGAMDHEDISEFQIGLEKRSKYFTKIQLKVVETKVLDGVRYLKWKINCVADFSAG